MMTTTQSQTITELAKALADVQGALQPAVKDATNPHFRSKYADLPAVWDACRALLTKHGLSVVQMPVEAGAGRVGLTTMLLHASGEYISSTVSTALQRDDAQGVGSALTYLRRYALASMVGIVADEDDDANKASEQRAARTSYQPPASQPVTNGNGTAGKASEKQIKKLFVMWKEGNFDGTLQDWIQKTYSCKVDDLNVKQASEAIESLQEPA
jgi:hypothetical protein